MQWALVHGSDSTQRYAFTEVAVCSDDTQEAERLSRRLPGLSVRVAASYELAAGRGWSPGDYAPVLTDAGLARSQTSGPFGGFMSLDLFDAEFMRYAGDMRWRSSSQAHGLFRGETQAKVQRTMSECSADSEDSRANIRIRANIRGAGLGERWARRPARLDAQRAPRHLQAARRRGRGRALAVPGPAGAVLTSRRGPRI